MPGIGLVYFAEYDALDDNFEEPYNFYHIIFYYLTGYKVLIYRLI